MSKDRQYKNTREGSTIELWEALDKEFNLVFSREITDFMDNIDLTYKFLEDFIAFAKNKDQNICLTAISKDAVIQFATIDIKKCLTKYDSDKNHFIYYIDYQFKDDYNCPHGSGYKDVWIMFIGKEESDIINLLTRFKKLKVFI